MKDTMYFVIDQHVVYRVHKGHSWINYEWPVYIDSTAWRPTKITRQISATSVYDVRIGRGVPSEPSMDIEEFAISFYATFVYLYR